MKKTLFSFPFLTRTIILLIFALSPSINTSTFLNFPGKKMNEKPAANRIVYPSVFDLTEEDKSWIEKSLENMSLKDKCAQMVMPWVLGNYMSEDSKEFQRIKKLVKELKVGGLIFFKGDIINEAIIINKMQALAGVPLLVAADFERGLAMRLTDATEFPYNMAIAATGDLSLAYQMAKAVSLESRTIGVHQNYAPVADINNNAENPIINIRSFSEDKGIVGQFCASFIAGTNEEKVLSTVKHFPGHGNTKIDSHKDMPTISGDKDYLLNNELLPFAHSIKAGVHSVMVGHLNVPGLEKEKIPATLSKSIITDLLKNEMGFGGLVVTDAMNMNAITKYYSGAEAAVAAVNAGNDLILFPPDEEVAINAIHEGVESGKINVDRINESVRKILAAKKWLELDKRKFSDLDEITKIVNQESHQRIAGEIAKKSITLVINENNIIPVDPDKVNKTACITVTEGLGSDTEKIFQNEIDKKFGSVKSFTLNKKSRPADYSKALEIAKNADLVLLPAFIKVRAYQGTVKLSKEHTDFINEILSLKKPSVIMSFGNPYLLSVFPNAKVYICAYGDASVSQVAMAEAITGGNDITGVLPVSIPKTGFSIGHGVKKDRTTLKFEENQKFELNFHPVDDTVIEGIQNKLFPGGVLLVGKKGKVVYQKAFGKFTFDSDAAPVMKEAIFDLGSFSQVVGTATAAMILYEEGKLILDEKVKYYLPDFGNNGKENILVRNLLAHNSGLVNARNFSSFCTSREEMIKAVMQEKPGAPAGSETFYSDLNMIALQIVIEKISGTSLDKFLNKKIFEPLKMNRTMYNPPVELRYYCAPTISSGKKINKGVVDDENAFLLNGVAGHTGLFSTAQDIAIFLQMIMQNGSYGNMQFFKSSTIDEWMNFQSDKKEFFNHSSSTGASVWFDREQDLFVILLRNNIDHAGNAENVSFENKIYAMITAMNLTTL